LRPGYRNDSGDHSKWLTIPKGVSNMPGVIAGYVLAGGGLLAIVGIAVKNTLAAKASR
jgi:hypothetical protein